MMPGNIPANKADGKASQETDPAQIELAQIAARPPAAEAAVAMAALVLRFLQILGDFGGGSH